MQYTLVSLPYLLYAPSLYFLCAYPGNIHVFQAAKGIEIGSDTVVDVLESVERLFRHLDMYTQIPHSPALDEMVVKIVLELLSILELATKRLTQGRLSESTLVELLPLLNLMQRDLSRMTLEMGALRWYPEPYQASPGRLKRRHPDSSRM